MAEFRSQDNFGLDRELKEKEEAKRDLALERKVQNYVEELAGERFASDNFFAALKDGVLLCKMMNTVKPGAIKKINESSMPFKKMENISNFLRACRSELKMSEHDLFTTPDLFDERSAVNVVSGIVAFSRAATRAGFDGPSIAPKESSIRKSLKRWSLNARNSAVSLLNMGSAGVMDKNHSHIDRSRDINFGAQHSGTGSSEVSRLAHGSAGVMDKNHTHIDRTRDINFGAQHSGPSSNELTKLAMGSAGVMDKHHAHIDRTRDVTFGANAGQAA